MADVEGKLCNEVNVAESKRAGKRKAKQATKKQRKKAIKVEKNTKSAGFDKEIFLETTCFVRNGLRCVYPYYFTFTTFCKGRWVGRSLIDVFKEEFRSETQEYYEKAIKAGKITVNGEITLQSKILKDNDVICNKVHRHEPPVTGNPIKIIALTDEVVVLDKPSSIPVHPCGRYRHNTIVFLLGKEFGLKNLFTIHRIDRLTSGILMFARTLSKAQELESQVRNRQIGKEYISRVQGEFPSEEVLCEEPIKVVSHKIGVCRVSKNEGKPCKTVFKRLTYDGKTSIVKSVPHTGRMHQIRVHLQWLGYPIVNDPIYNHQSWGPHRGKGGVSDHLVQQVIAELSKSPNIVNTESGTFREDDLSRQHQQNSTNVKHEAVTIVENESLKPVCTGYKDIVPGESQSCKETDEKNTELYYDKDCSECQIQRRDPTSDELTMCLHALSYKGPDWEFKTDLPSWAKEGVNFSEIRQNMERN